MARTAEMADNCRKCFIQISYKNICIHYHYSTFYWKKQVFSAIFFKINENSGNTNRDINADNCTSMVQMWFFLRYKAQLRRTRPDLVHRLEKAVTRAIGLAGGKIAPGNIGVLAAAFKGDSLGFWLDILILIETVMAEMDADAGDLYGYSLVLSKEAFKAGASQMPGALCRFLAGGGQGDQGSRGGGVFMDRAVREGLLPYILAEEPEQRARSWAARRGAASDERIESGDWYRLDSIKVLAAEKDNSLQESVVNFLIQKKAADQDEQRNTLILGPAFPGKREGLYRYCAGICGDVPPLLVRFGRGGLAAITDAWSPLIQALAGAGTAEAAHIEEIQSMWALLFRERLREEVTDFTMRNARRFFAQVLDFYCGAARRKGLLPVLIVENLHQAENVVAELFIDAVMRNTGGLLVMGTADEADGVLVGEVELRKWEKIFPRIVRPNVEGVPPSRAPDMPVELWEIAYVLFLFSRYFPAHLFPRLLEEEGKNPAVISRALSLLAGMGIIDSPGTGYPWTDCPGTVCSLADNCTGQAEAVLGTRGERVRALVRSRLIAWVEQRKLNPCFRLLTIMTELGGAGQLTDQLILSSITADLVNGISAAVERARNDDLLEIVTGPERADVIRFIFETTRALISGNAAAIRAAFRDPPPDCAAFPVLKTQILSNIAVYHLGQRDNISALEPIKEAILLSQGKSKICLARAYRLFSLVNLTRKRTGEAIDYIGFAVDNAEKSGNYHELGVSAYYAAAIQFLYGNVSRAAMLTRKAREQAMAAGCGEWADRSHFLEGRLAFETGRYREALDIFETLRRESLDRSPAGTHRERLLSAWAYRARVYEQNPLCPKPADGGPDADLFEVEAAYLAGDFDKVVALAGVLGGPCTEDNFLYTEQPDWRSGFAQCELLYFSQSDLWDRILCVYHSLALCRLSAAGGEEARHNMRRILKNEQLSEMDPWDAFYFYAWYRILEQTGGGQVDMNTAVSMAFKRLQRRASRIDDVETRRQFLFQPRWNSALSMAAREFKLI
jgi:tetratricopeptide (TPR) repeat protein